MDARKRRRWKDVEKRIGDTDGHIRILHFGPAIDWENNVRIFAASRPPPFIDPYELDTPQGVDHSLVVSLGIADQRVGIRYVNRFGRGGQVRLACQYRITVAEYGVSVIEIVDRLATKILLEIRHRLLRVQFGLERIFGDVLAHAAEEGRAVVACVRANVSTNETDVASQCCD